MIPGGTWRRNERLPEARAGSLPIVQPRIALVSFHATAVVYTGGTVAQLLKLRYAFPWTEMPFVVDWLIVVLGSAGVGGLIWFHRSIAMGNHDFYAAFPYEYSYFAVLYFALFAWRSWTVRLLSQ